MAIFPDSNTIKPVLEYESGEMENVRRNPAEAGDTQIRDVWGVTKFFADFEMDLSVADSATMIAFARANRADTFTFYDYDSSIPFEDVAIGTGTGAELTFTIPGKETSAQTVEVADGVGGWTTKTVVTHYNITAGTGALGEDRVVFTGGNAPANGRAVRISFTGRYRYECDMLVFERRVSSTMGRKRFRIRVEEAF